MPVTTNNPETTCRRPLSSRLDPRRAVGSGGANERAHAHARRVEKRVAVLPHKGLPEEPLVSIRARLRGRFSQIILLNIIGAGPRWRELM